MSPSRARRSRRRCAPRERKYSLCAAESRRSVLRAAADLLRHVVPALPLADLRPELPGSGLRLLLDPLEELVDARAEPGLLAVGKLVAVNVVAAGGDVAGDR